MPIVNINVGSAPNDGTGDPLRSAFQTINANFSFLDLPALANGAAKDGRFLILDNTPVDTLRKVVLGDGCIKFRGYNAPFDYLAAAFTMPASGGGTGSATMTNQATTNWMPAVGQKISIASLGLLRITSKTGNTIGLANDGDAGNAAPGTIAASGQTVSTTDMPSVHFQHPEPGLKFYRDDPGTAATEIMSLGVWDNHNGNVAATPETIWRNAGRVAILAGANGVAPNGIQMGANGWSSGYMVMGYGTAGAADGLPITSGYGHSQFIAFPSVTNAGVYAYPFIMGVNDSATVDVGTKGYGELWLGPVAPEWSGGSYATYPGVVMTKINRYGVNLRGGVTVERATATSGSSYAINFTTGKSVTDISTSATAITFTTAGFPASGNAVKRVIILRANGLSPTLNFPSNWVWLNDAGTGAAPASLAVTKMMVLEVTALGSTDSYVFARYSVADDKTFAWDTDAAAYFTRASITDDIEKSAYNNFFLALKAASIYTKFDCIYFFPREANYGYNAVSSSYDITWANSPTHNNVLGDGVSFNGTNQYGDTGYNPSSGSLKFTLNSNCMVAYCGTTTPNDTGTLMGSQNSGGSFERAILYRTGTTASMWGNNDPGTTPTPIAASSDWTGLWIGCRTSSTAKTMNLRNVSQASSSGTATTLVNANFYVGARNAGGASNYLSGNLKLVMLGAGLNNTEIAALQAAVASLKSALGWP